MYKHQVFAQFVFAVECFTTEMANDRCVFGLLAVVKEDVEVFGLVMVPECITVVEVLIAHIAMRYRMPSLPDSYVHPQHVLLQTHILEEVFLTDFTQFRWSGHDLDAIW